MGPWNKYQICSSIFLIFHWPLNWSSIITLLEIISELPSTQSRWPPMYSLCPQHITFELQARNSWGILWSRLPQPRGLQQRDVKGKGVPSENVKGINLWSAKAFRGPLKETFLKQQLRRGFVPDRSRASAQFDGVFLFLHLQPWTEET